MNPGALFLQLLTTVSLPGLILMACLLIYCLVKGADLMVEEAVGLSHRLGISEMLIGATLVSLGTTLPEVTVSVFAAVQGRPEIALGNAVGSIICNTGLILGLVTFFSPVSLKNRAIQQQGWVQLVAGILLVISCVPFLSHEAVFTSGGTLPRQMGILFLVLLILYLWFSFRFMNQQAPLSPLIQSNQRKMTGDDIKYIILKITGCSVLVAVSSHFLIPVVLETSVRLSIPGELISATLVAFGTSLPELVTAITAVRKGSGELAVGNIIGANILNVLFVAGASASIASGGLQAPAYFFSLLFPAMLGTLVVFRVSAHYSGAVFKRQYSIILLGIYSFVTLSCYFKF